MEFQNEIRTFDLFCGGGGSSIGAQLAGATPVGGVDMWPVGAEAYCQNLRGSRVYTADIGILRPQTVADELGQIDLLLASPECTHHSVAKGSKPRDEESKRLAFEVIRFARVLGPRWIVVENVIQMESWPSFPNWLREIHGLGYHTICMKLDAASFGVPQTRRRLFVICDRERFPAEPRARHRKNATVEWLLQRAKPGHWSYQFTPLESSGRAPATLARARRAIKELGSDKEFIMVYYGSDGAGGFQALNRPLRTVTTLDRFALVRPNCNGHEMRMLQPPELALAMGFPAKYRFPASATRRDCIKLLGNAVCPPVMKAIVKSLTSSAVRAS